MVILMLGNHHLHPVINLIEKRMEVIKKRLMKANENDWYDYSDDSLFIKLCEASPEFSSLNLFLDELTKEMYKKQDDRRENSHTQRIDKKFKT